MKNDKKMIKKNEKNEKKMKKNSRKIAIFQKMKNCNFPRVFFMFFIFFHFFHVFIIFHHFCFQWCKNFARNGKLQFSSSFFHFVYHVLKFFASSGGIDEK